MSACTIRSESKKKITLIANLETGLSKSLSNSTCPSALRKQMAVSGLSILFEEGFDF